MLKKAIKYKNLNDEEVEEDFYFNLSSAELLEMELVHEGGSFGDYMKRIVASKDKGKLITEFKNLILLAYGEKSEDGRHFVKSPDISHMFTMCPAYSVLFMELSTDEKKALDFVRGILPDDLQGDIPDQDKPKGPPPPPQVAA